MPRQPFRRRTISQRSELIYDTHEFCINSDTRELFLHWHYCDPEPMLDNFASSSFIKNLLLLNVLNPHPILVHMNTNGGDWGYGMAIYDAVSSSQAPVTILTYAHARSMSSIIPQAATHRVIMPNADVLLHYGTSGYDGNTMSSISEAEWDRILIERMLEIYANRCVQGSWFKKRKWGRARIVEWLRKQIDSRQEFYLDARQACDYGLMDAVLGDPGYETVELLRKFDPEAVT